MIGCLFVLVYFFLLRGVQQRRGREVQGSPIGRRLTVPPPEGAGPLWKGKRNIIRVHKRRRRRRRRRDDAERFSETRSLTPECTPL